MAAVLAAGSSAALSHASAAALWTIRAEASEETVHVAVPSTAGRQRRAGIYIHRLRTLYEDEVALERGIPVTTPARTLLDIAGRLQRRPLERAADEAERLRLCDAESLFAIARNHRGHPGNRRLRALLARHEVGSTITRSQLEERFLALCRRQNLPTPLVNTPIEGFVADFLWPKAALVVELDGRATHGTRRAFQADRDRDTSLAALGYRTLRFTWWDVTKRQAVVGNRIGRVLAQHGPTSQARVA